MDQRTPDSAIGARLRRNIGHLLIRRGMTTSDLYNRLGLSSTRWSRIFKLPKGPRVAMLDRIAAELGVTTDELLREEDKR